MQFDKVRSDEVSQSLLGMSFEMCGRGPKKIDCYGLIVLYFKGFDVNLPDYSYTEDWEKNSELFLSEYAKCFRKLDPTEKPEIGDVILFHWKENPTHAGVYLGGGRFIHSYDKAGTRIDSLTNPHWKQKVDNYFRIKEDENV